MFCVTLTEKPQYSLITAFRLMNFCDNPFDRGYDQNPSVDLDPAKSVNETAPDTDVAQPDFNDDDIQDLVLDDIGSGQA